MLVPSFLTGFMAWKVRDVDATYAETYWILVTAVVQLEVIIVAIPMIFILRDVTVDGRYVGLVFLTWILPMSALGFIIGPKIRALRRHQLGSNEAKQ